jgi:hypothetical protein
VQAACVALDVLRQRRDGGVDVRAVDAEVDEPLGSGVSRERGRPHRGGETYDMHAERDSVFH